MYNEISNHSVRQLIRACTRGYLSTQLNLLKSKNSILKKISVPVPYATFVTIAFDYDASPILILSDLSEHTKNLKNNNFVSLLIYEEQIFREFFAKFNNPFKKSGLKNYEDPMSRPRLSIIGKLEKYQNITAKKRFLSRHPVSRLYSEFSDMNLYRLDIINAHLTAGFAKVKWFSREELLCKKIFGENDDEFNVIKHMNDCHQESIDLYMKSFFKKGKGWKIIGIDSEGFDLRFGPNVMRYYFEKSLKKTSDMRKVFVQLHKKANSFQN